MVRNHIRNHVCHPNNLSQNNTSISNADSIWPIHHLKHAADWEHIRQRKQLRINGDNKNGNMCRNNHQYKVGDKILVKRKRNSNHESEFMGPLSITQINDNGTICFQKGIINDATNIRRIKPFSD